VADQAGQEIKPADGQRPTATMTATAWLTRAEEYRAASLAAPDGHPKVFLALHATELLLKGLILRQAGDLGALSHTHDLGDLLRAVGVDAAGYPHLINADPKMTYFRYPKELHRELDSATVLREADALWEHLNGGHL
jgi:HEPN domain-containing protein